MIYNLTTFFFDLSCANRNTGLRLGVTGRRARIMTPPVSARSPGLPPRRALTSVVRERLGHTVTVTTRPDGGPPASWLSTDAFLTEGSLRVCRPSPGAYHGQRRRGREGGKEEGLRRGGGREEGRGRERGRGKEGGREDERESERGRERESHSPTVKFNRYGEAPSLANRAWSRHRANMN